MYMTVRLKDGTMIEGQSEGAKDKFEGLVESGLEPKKALNTIFDALNEQSAYLGEGLRDITQFSLVPADATYGDVVHFNMDDVSYISIHNVEEFVQEMYELGEEQGESL